jgi:hypothetical protein
MIKVETTFIDYDTDDNTKIAKVLPQHLTFEFEDIAEANESLADKISDETGYCVFSCEFMVVKDDKLN